MKQSKLCPEWVKELGKIMKNIKGEMDGRKKQFDRKKG